MGKIKPLIIIAISGFILAGCNKHSDKTAANKTESTITVATKPNNIELFFKARIEPIKKTNISSPIDAVVKSINFTYGQRITKGQLLLVLSSEQLKKDYQDALTAFLKAKADYHNQRLKSEGLEELWKIQALSKNQYIEEKQQITNIFLSYRQAEQRLKELAEKIHDQKLSDLTKLNVDEINKIERALAANTGEMSIVAPSDGIALYPEKTEADQDSTNSRLLEGTAIKAGQGLLEIGDMSGLALYINVNEININSIKPGQKVNITGVAFPNILLHGQVKEVDIQAKNNLSSGLPTFPVKIEVAKVAESELRQIHVGMSAEVKLTIEQPPAIRVPLRTLIIKDNKTFAKLIDKEGKIKEVEVITGHTTLDEVVIAKGLQAGDKLVVPNRA